MAILEVKNLKTVFQTDEGELTAVDNVSFSINAKETIGIVGESGCGKSVAALSIIRLVPNPPGKIAGGEIIFQGENLLNLSSKEMRGVRGNKISMIFQEPMTSLNPVFTVGDQIMESILLHQKCKKGEAKQKAIDMLKLVGIPSPERRVNEYPHQLSGGMRQRVMIAMALSCNPTLLIADEPTTALDVTIQAQILDLVANLKKQLGMAVMLITHDLGVVAEVCDYVIVMYAGKVVEQGTVKDIFLRPGHPYTKGLLNSLPSISRESSKKRLETISGIVPNLLFLPPGCCFQDRCIRKREKCEKDTPHLENLNSDKGHKAACFYPYKEGEAYTSGEVP